MKVAALCLWLALLCGEPAKPEPTAWLEPPIPRVLGTKPELGPMPRPLAPAVLRAEAAAVVAKIDGPHEAKPGNSFVLTTKGTTGKVRWWLVNPQLPATDNGESTVWTELLDKQSNDVLLVQINAPGTYWFNLIVVNGTAPTDHATATHQVIVREPGPTPPGPGPQPPGPVPSALQASLQAAYAADTDPQKAAHVAALADLLGAIVGTAKASGTVNKASDLQNAVHNAINLAIGANGLPEVRKVGTAYLMTKMPTTDQPMSDAIWATAATEYGNLSVALKGVK